MTNENQINSAELMNEAELDQVAGGTVKELEELFRAVVNNPNIKNLAGALAHIPGTNNMIRDFMETFLHDKLHIGADISLGLAGTGLFSLSNKYKELESGYRHTLSHQEVLNRIKNYKG